ncbi:MAG TPA: DUF6504 family protein [Allosphingosinicella sp.]
MEAQIEALPLHQRPGMRELGRRSEAAEVAYRGRFGKAEEVSAPSGLSKVPEFVRPERSRGAHARSLCQRPSTSLGTNESAHSHPLSSHPSAPLVTALRTGNRQLLAAASPAARALGLAPGMPLTQARALVPGLDIRDAAPEADAALLESLALFAARRWTPRAAVSPPDGLFLDLTGVSHLFGGEEALCVHFVHFCARLGFTARIAVAGTYGAAHALARFSGKAIALCPSGAEAQALAPMPLSALRIGEEALGAARRLGLERVGELLAMPRAPLQRRFGKTLLQRLDQAIGRAPEAVDAVVPEDAPEAELRFAEPIASPEAIAAALGRLMTDLAATLGKRALGARSVRLLCLRVDNEEQRIGVGTARATRDASHLLRLMLPKIEEIEPGYGIDAMRLVALRTEPLAAQTIEGALAGGKPAPDLSFLIDRLAGRLGARRLFRIGAVESDVPERSVRRLSPLAKPAEWPRWPRPVRLLSPPERVEGVVALLPDLPPRRFTWRGRPYRVRAADGPERIHGEWWRAREEADAVRDYFQVEDEEGARFWLFRRGDGVDIRTGDLSWYLHGVFA